MKNKKGITLIALIITIIVMLILAGVAISMAIGDNGVIDRAQEAMKENERADVQEIIIGSYVFKVTGATNTFAYIDIPKTGIAMYENLTSNGFTVKESDKITIDGEEFDTVKIDSENNKIDVTVEGKHGEYTGTVTDKGLKEDLEIVEDEIIIGDTNLPEEPEESEKFTFTLGELANYQNDDPSPGCLESSRVSAIIMFPQTVSEELIFGTPHSTQNGYWINNITCSDSSIVDATFATSDPGPNFFQFVNKHETTYADSIPFYSARLIIYINGTMITSNNYQPYADLTFTITK